MSSSTVGGAGATSAASVVDTVAPQLRSTTKSVLVTSEQRQLAADCKRYLYLLAAFAGPALANGITAEGSSGSDGGCGSSKMTTSDVGASNMASILGRPPPPQQQQGSAVASDVSPSADAGAVSNELMGLDLLSDPNRATSLLALFASLLGVPSRGCAHGKSARRAGWLVCFAAQGCGGRPHA